MNVISYFGSWLPFQRPCSFASPSFDGFAIIYNFMTFSDTL